MSAALRTVPDADASAGRREQRRRALHDVNREHLLDAAEEVFGERGYADATVKEIAERAEFSVGAVYGLVEGKEDLFLQTLRRRGDDMIADISTLVADDTLGGLDALGRLADLQIGYFRDHPHFGRLWLRQAGPSGWNVAAEALDGLADNVGVAMDLQAQLVRRGQAAGEIRPGDPEVLARIFSAVVQAFQATDPACVGDPAGERLSLSELHDLLEGAFAP